MSFKLPSLPKARTKDLYERITAGLETFSWSELSDISEIDRGTFGSVLLASFSNATGRLATSEKVVVKKLLPSSRSDEKQRFFKEARLLQGINHKNVVPFKRLCTEPPAIMMEFVSFRFKPFSPDSDKHVSNLEDFLGYLDETEAVDALPPCLYRKIAHDVANGLKYLHESNVYHRDLKTSNVLVSNTHYCDMGDNDELLAAFNVEPIVCKLTDFGESRSEQIQTQLMANTRTSNVDRGTPSFMAPEIHTLREVGAEDLKRIDMWAYGMWHCLI
jgi:serine/threonine protein kinase